jgi:hypothetical protein
MPLSDLTSKIVQARDSKKTDFRTMKNNLNNIENVLKHISSLCSDDIWLSLINDSNCSELWTTITKKAEELSESVTPFIAPNGDFTIAYNRANREFVNVGAIGITREGKSEYIARTTQLGEWLLPRRTANQPCTTAPINIINGPSKDNKENFVRIHFFTVSEMIEQLRNFVSELGGNRDIIPNNISTKDQLKKWIEKHKIEVDEDLSNRVSKEDLSKKNEFIEGYFSHADQYVDLLVEEPSAGHQYYKDLLIDQINQGGKDGELYYSSVSYYKRPNAPTTEKSYKSYATKLAEVYTQFNVANEQVSNIQFLDTPGIGEQKVGIERALSDTVAMNLDVIIVVKSVRNELNNQDANRNTLITLLRDRLNNKDHAPKSVYFLLNMWENVGYEEGTAEKNNLKKLLQSGYRSSAIRLEDNQFRMINIVDNYEVVPQDEINYSDPLGRYLSDIFNAIIPRISRIDEDYFCKTEAEYKKISEAYKDLKSRMRTLENKLPSLDISDIVDDTLASLHEALNVVTSREIHIDGGIDYSIQKFCEQNAGILLSKTIDSPSEGFTDIEDYKQIDKFCKEHQDALAKHYSKSDFNSFMGFQQYEGFKIELCDQIISTIYNCINTEQAELELKETKDVIANVFITKGKLGFVSNDPSKWWQEMAQLLSDENADESLIQVFSNLGKFFIDYKEALKPKLVEIIRKCKHCDDFGNPKTFNFQEYESALRAIVHSLLHIEQTVQDAVEESVVKRDIKSLISTFENTITNLMRAVSLPKNNQLLESRKALVRFYKKHANEIFVGDNEAAKRALITSWHSQIN